MVGAQVTQIKFCVPEIASVPEIAVPEIAEGGFPTLSHTFPRISDWFLFQPGAIQSHGVS